IIKMNKLFCIFIVIIILLLSTNIYFYDKIQNYKKQITYIDTDFRAGLGRVAGALKDGNEFISLEHAYKLNALSKYTSFSRGKFWVESYASEIANSLQNKYSNNKNPKDIDEISKLLLDLSSDPENQEKSNKLILLLRSE
ncbi:MAG: hypothetical protein JWM44_2486, partial [Bacilli bacterium]|nr:hypothetical protein [Bacilli bacterium]